MMQADKETLERVRKLFEQDRFATENGAVIDWISENASQCSLTLTERHKNAAGGVMGGVPFMLADFTFAVAANWQSMGTVSLDTSISFLGMAKGERLIARAECVKNGRTAVFYHVSVQDELKNPVEDVHITGYRKSGS